MPIPTPSPTWGTIDTAAEILCVSAKTIRRRIADGSIEARRFGPRLVRVNLESLAEAGRPLQYLGGGAA